MTRNRTITPIYLQSSWACLGRGGRRVHQEPMTTFHPGPGTGGDHAQALDVQSLLAYLSQILSNHLELNQEPAGSEAFKAPSSADDGQRPSPLALGYWVSQAYAERRLRDRLFDDPEIFGEPAWDALLDIAHSETKGERLAVTSACIGSCAPPTTALRWLKVLEERGLVTREADSSDARRSFVKMTAEGRRKVERYFQEVKRLRSS